MSYGWLNHDNRSRHALSQGRGPRSPPLGQHSASEDDASIDLDERQETKGDFELKDLYPAQSDWEEASATFDPGSEEWESEDEENVGSPRARRTSTSTVQSFMLYTPEEERSVIRKFDRRLVLFVALLYMLSFLDRSSTYPRAPDEALLNVSQTLGMQESLACLMIYISTLCNMSGKQPRANLSDSSRDMSCETCPRSSSIP